MMQINHPYEYAYTPNSNIFARNGNNILYKSHNTETLHSPLREFADNCYKMELKRRHISSKKIFPLLTYGNNAQLPDYFKNSLLPDSRSSIQDLRRHNQSKKIFLDKVGQQECKQEQVFQRKRRCNYPNSNFKEGREYQPHEFVINPERYERKYNLRKFDIISGEKNIPYEHFYNGAQNNYFKDFQKCSFPTTERNDIRTILNRYSKLNGGEFIRNVKRSNCFNNEQFY